MYELDAKKFNKEEFLRDYWQKKPVIIRQAFLNFEAPIEADEVAGLAGIDDVESRIVYRDGDKYEAEFGPFDDFERLGEKNWSLIVQALDHWSEDSAKMIEPFRFIPNWRLDDLMVSYGVPGGGVGPHIDWYDVFICQGTGIRNWRVGDKGDHVEYAAHPALLHVEPFEPIIDTKVYPGDILYIPPGFPHDGVTIEHSLSFSVGFRANSAVSLLSGLADHLIDNELGGSLICDPERVATSHSGAIDTDDYQKIVNHLTSLTNNNAQMRDFIGSFYTQAKHELDQLKPDDPFSEEEVAQYLKTNELRRLGGLRAFYFSDNVEEGAFYVNGDKYEFAGEISPLIRLLCDNVTITPLMISPSTGHVSFVSLITKLINEGYWYFSD